MTTRSFAKCILTALVVLILIFLVAIASLTLKRRANFKSYETKIMSLGELGKYDEALVLLEEVKKKFPKRQKFYTSLYYHIAEGYYKTGRVDQAHSLLRGVTVEHPLDHKNWALFARVLSKLGKNAKAMSILERYPHDADTLADDLKRSPLDVWTKYNLAASYALLNNRDLAILYMVSVLYYRGFRKIEDVDRIFQHFQEDPDFDSLRQDQRYVFFANAVDAETFDDAVAIIEKRLNEAFKAISAFYLKTKSERQTLASLEQIVSEVQKVKPVAPVLNDIRASLIRFIQTAIFTIPQSEASGDPSKKQEALDVFKRWHQMIAKWIEEAKRNNKEK